MAEHRVLAHLGLAARDYDAAIRRYIPYYEDMIATVVDLVDGLIIDLGTGTGALASAILEAKPSTHVRLVDIDPAMLDTAAARVAPFVASGRAETVRASFEDALPPSSCDAVVASLALHHVPTHAAKRALYAQIHAALRPGGILAIADATMHADGRERARMYDEWATWMAAHDIARAEADGLFAKWAGEDYYVPLAQELALLADAGFAHPDCFWKRGPSTVYGAYR